jgi:DtxR family Mn-dependent transcriptional regulator
LLENSEKMILSQSEENYIKAIYSIEEFLAQPGYTVSTNDLAEKIETKASSVTDMVKKLADKKLLIYTPYQGCKLTEKGRQIALKTIRKHRLWETFLVNKLGFGWDEVHPIAEQLEHIQSLELTNRLDEFLEYPKFDPHGDPIPDKNGVLQHRESIRKLNELAIDDEGLVIGVSDGSPTFLRYLDSQEIKLGVRLRMVEVFEFDNSCRVQFNGQLINLSAAAASKITVQV